ncbi:MAG: hypothetical protein M3Y41_08805 [Pseudomonadota bacterium]|nr:hypothetical protein [Pseudomonadota bacterium]
MKTMQCLKVVMGSVLLAAAVYIILAAPGLSTDDASTVPLDRQIATVRP